MRAITQHGELEHEQIYQYKMLNPLRNSRKQLRIFCYQQSAAARHILILRKKAIMQRGSLEHEQIIYVSSNRRTKQLMDWLSKPR